MHFLTFLRLWTCVWNICYWLIGIFNNKLIKQLRESMKDMIVKLDKYVFRAKNYTTYNNRLCNLSDVLTCRGIRKKTTCCSMVKRSLISLACRIERERQKKTKFPFSNYLTTSNYRSWSLYTIPWYMWIIPWANPPQHLAN